MPSSTRTDLYTAKITANGVALGMDLTAIWDPTIAGRSGRTGRLPQKVFLDPLSVTLAYNKAHDAYALILLRAANLALQGRGKASTP